MGWITTWFSPYCFLNENNMYLTKDQLLLAYKKAKKWKSTQNIWIKKWIENEEKNLDILYKELVSEKYTISKPKRYIIQDPVLREIICVPFRDRIIQHLIPIAIYIMYGLMFH